MICCLARGRVLFTCLFLIIFFAFKAHGRSHLHIVGSSAVYPFITGAAELFSVESPFHPPIIESTGTGGGIKIFCNGIGEKYPDIVATSRLMSKDELNYCHQNGAHNILKVTLGYDGIVIAKATPHGIKSLSLETLFQALSKFLMKDQKKVKNPYFQWNEIVASLPKQKIKIFGPPSTSGTKQTFLQLVLTSSHHQSTHPPHPELRSDHVYIETAEQETITARKLPLEKGALAIFTFGFLTKNRQQIFPIKIDGYLPSYESIASGQYPLSRPLYLYIKGERFLMNADLKEFIIFLLRDDISGEKGYLRNYGFIPLSKQLKEEQITMLKTYEALHSNLSESSS